MRQTNGMADMERSIFDTNYQLEEQIAYSHLLVSILWHSTAIQQHVSNSTGWLIGSSVGIYRDSSVTLAAKH